MDPMIRINLLDWREARRELRKRQFLTALGGAAMVAVGLLFLVITAYGNAIDHQRARNRYLQHQIAVVDKQITEIKALEKTRDDLITRMRIIEQLQQSRAQIVHYFDQIVATLPKGVYLSSLKQNGDTTTVDGLAQSNERVSTYMTNLDSSDWFVNPRLIVIKSKKASTQHIADFTLSFKTTTPAAKKHPDDAAETSADKKAK